jgi:hypothetical protein
MHRINSAAKSEEAGAAGAVGICIYASLNSDWIDVDQIFYHSSNRFNTSSVQTLVGRKLQ